RARTRGGPARRASTAHGCLRSRGDPVRPPDRPAAARRDDGERNAGTGPHPGAGPAVAVQFRGDAAAGGGLPEVPAEESVAARPPLLRPAQAPALLPGQPLRPGLLRRTPPPPAARGVAPRSGVAGFGRSYAKTGRRRALRTDEHAAREGESMTTTDS